MTIEMEEWRQRYVSTLVKRAGIGPEVAEMELNAAHMDDIYLGYEDDPEGSAIESMGYWE